MSDTKMGKNSLGLAKSLFERCLGCLMIFL